MENSTSHVLNALMIRESASSAVAKAVRLVFLFAFAASIVMLWNANDYIIS